MKVYLESNCCIRRNSEFTKMHKYLEVNNYQISLDPADADYIVLSTCAFKEQEESYSLSRVRHLKQFPGKFLVMGCLPDIAPEKYGEFNGIAHIAPKEIEKVDSFFPNITTKFNDVEDTNVIPDELNVSSVPQAFEKLRNDFELSSTFGLRIWRYLEKKFRILFGLNPPKFYLFISKGCLGNCSYCAIKRAIGILQSRPGDIIVKQFRNGLSKGYEDFIILGDDVGAYGKDIGQSFPGLLAELQKEMESYLAEKTVFKWRTNGFGFHIQEIHPRWLIMYKEQLLDILKSGKIKSILCPIESGNDRVLDLMKRRYNADEILDFFARARAIHPEVQLSTHVMAGFPSETEAEFEDSLKLVAKIHFDQVTVFPYDSKEGTVASNIIPKVDDHLIKRRIKKAQDFFRREDIKIFLSCPE